MIKIKLSENVAYKNKFIKTCLLLLLATIKKVLLRTQIGTFSKSLLTHLGVQLLVGCQFHHSTRWQCHTQKLDEVLTSSQNAANLLLQQGNGTHRKHTEGLEESHMTALGLRPKTMKLYLSTQFSIVN